MNFIIEPIAIVLGFILKFIYNLIPNYFVAIFLFVLLTRILMFPLSLKTQKGQADRARLAPRLERIQKKYAKDPKKMQEKQMELYEKHGVSPTGGCMPMIIQMVVLFGIISVIYSPLKHLSPIPDNVVDATASAITVVEAEEGKTLSDEEKLNNAVRVSANDMKGIYRELRILKYLGKSKDEMIAQIAKVKVEKDKEYGLEKATQFVNKNYDLLIGKTKIITAIAKTKDVDGKEYGEAKAKEYYDQMVEFEHQFRIGKKNLLENPWNEKGFMGINILWLIPIISGTTALLSSMLSMHYTKQSTAGGQQQQAQGCSNVMMFVMMPAMSLFIAFSVPGAVGIYWVCSNVIAIAQTYILNHIYNPAKIRAQAEKEYEERRQKKAEDKKRLAEARAREQRELALQMNEEKKDGKKGKGKPKAKPAEETPAEPVEEAPAEDAPADEPTETESADTGDNAE